MSNTTVLDARLGFARTLFIFDNSRAGSCCARTRSSPTSFRRRRGRRVARQRAADYRTQASFAIKSGVTAQFRVEALNACNRVQFAAPNTSVTSSSFGVISAQANAPRQLQFGFKVLW